MTAQQNFSEAFLKYFINKCFSLDRIYYIKMTFKFWDSRKRLFYIFYWVPQVNWKLYGLSWKNINSSFKNMKLSLDLFTPFHVILPQFSHSYKCEEVDFSQMLSVNDSWLSGSLIHICQYEEITVDITGKIVNI